MPDIIKKHVIKFTNTITLLIAAIIFASLFVVPAFSPKAFAHNLQYL
tara:strand:+ start:7420 stop:7560 length:141 start_codon:yes stop_codon:yes gene_type:complete